MKGFKETKQNQKPKNRSDKLPDDSDRIARDLKTLWACLWEEWVMWL